MGIEKIKYGGRLKLTGSKNGNVTKSTGWFHNIILDSTDCGLNLIRRGMLGDAVIPSIEITSGEIGTGDTTPTTADTALEELVLDGILRAYQTIESDEVVFQFFISAEDLPDDTYTEFGLRVGTRLFSRALIIPTFEKSSGEDITVEYRIRLTNEETS
jgi:hypothetical protein